MDKKKDGQEDVHTVIVLDREGARLNNCRIPRARRLMKQEKAVMVSKNPFTIKLFSEPPIQKSQTQEF